MRKKIMVFDHRFTRGLDLCTCRGGPICTLNSFFFFFPKNIYFLKKTKKNPKTVSTNPSWAHGSPCSPMRAIANPRLTRSHAGDAGRPLCTRGDMYSGVPATSRLAGQPPSSCEAINTHTHHKMYSHVIHCQRYHRSQEQAIHTHSLAIISNPATDSAQKQPRINQSTATNPSINSH
jgi:hypothetical protein